MRYYWKGSTPNSGALLLHYDIQYTCLSAEGRLGSQIYTGDPCPEICSSFETNYAWPQDGHIRQVLISLVMIDDMLQTLQ